MELPTIKALMRSLVLISAENGVKSCRDCEIHTEILNFWPQRVERAVCLAARRQFDTLKRSGEIIKELRQNRLNCGVSLRFRGKTKHDVELGGQFADFRFRQRGVIESDRFAGLWIPD